jgi:enoyl-CoA hydratase/long-chain 3-hydroxyacyl-CoA dehydrogenase
MQEMVDKGFLGRKSQPDGSGATKGFYVYPPGKAKGKKQLNPEAKELMAKFKKEDLKLSTEEVQQRMICRFVNEAVLCLEDGIIKSATDGDIGAVFGMGFPPFIGGPFRYVDAMGADKFVEMMEGFADKYGPQFTPCALLKQHAAEKKRFHPLKE